MTTAYRDIYLPCSSSAYSNPRGFAKLCVEEQLCVLRNEDGRAHERYKAIIECVLACALSLRRRLVLRRPAWPRARSASGPTRPRAWCAARHADARAPPWLVRRVHAVFTGSGLGDDLSQRVLGKRANSEPGAASHTLALLLTRMGGRSGYAGDPALDLGENVACAIAYHFKGTQAQARARRAPSLPCPRLTRH